MQSTELQLPDGSGHVDTALRECEAAIVQRQDVLRQQVASTLHRKLEGIITALNPGPPCTEDAMKSGSMDSSLQEKNTKMQKR
jgi:hypothetical protein